MKKVFLWLLVISMIAVFTLAGCKEEAAAEEETAAEEEVAEEEATEEEAAEEEVVEEEPITIALLTGSMSIVWEQDVEDALNALAAEDNGSIVTMDANFDSSKMMNQVDQLIAMEVDGVVGFVTDPLMGSAIVDKFSGAGIPFMFESIRLTDTEDHFVCPGVELDGYGQGELCGEYIGQWFIDNGYTAPYEGLGFIDLDNPTSWNIEQRADGVEDKFFEAVPDFPEDQFFRAEMPTGVTAAEGGYDTTTATITAHPELTTWFITGPNDDQAGGATRALEQAGLDENSVVVGMGAESSRDEWKKAEDTAWKASTFFKADDCIGLVWEGMMEMVRGGVAPEDLWPDFVAPGETYAVKTFNGVIVTKADYMEIMGKYAE